MSKVKKDEFTEMVKLLKANTPKRRKKHPEFICYVMSNDLEKFLKELNEMYKEEIRKRYGKEL